MAAKQVDDTLPMAGSKRTHFEFDPDYDHSSIPLEPDEIPVIIIGSSMVGMFMGLLLGYHELVQHVLFQCQLLTDVPSVRSLSFDRHPSTAIHPRAALFLLKTVEVLRQLNLSDRFAKES